MEISSSWGRRPCQDISIDARAWPQSTYHQRFWGQIRGNEAICRPTIFTVCFFLHMIRSIQCVNNSSISTIGGTLSSSKPMPESCIKLEEGKHQESIIRSFLGCPDFLLEAIRYFSNRRHVIETLQTHDDTLIQELARETQSMLDLTASFDCVEWASNSVQSKDLPAVKIEKLSLLSESYRTATLIYGNRVLRALIPSTGTVTPDYHGLVRQLLNVIDALKCEDALFKCLLWPTFIAGLECQNESEQQQVMRCLKTLWDLTSCLNIINASMIIQGHWRQKHFDGNSVPDESQLHVIGQGWLLV